MSLYATARVVFIDRPDIRLCVRDDERSVKLIGWWRAGGEQFNAVAPIPREHADNPHVHEQVARNLLAALEQTSRGAEKFLAVENARRQHAALRRLG